MGHLGSAGLIRDVERLAADAGLKVEVTTTGGSVASSRLEFRTSGDEKAVTAFSERLGAMMDARSNGQRRSRSRARAKSPRSLGSAPRGAGRVARGDALSRRAMRCVVLVLSALAACTVSREPPLSDFDCMHGGPCSPDAAAQGLDASPGPLDAGAAADAGMRDEDAGLAPRDAAPPLSDAAPPMSDAAPPLSDAAPPMSDAAPPMSDAAPPEDATVEPDAMVILDAALSDAGVAVDAGPMLTGGELLVELDARSASAGTLSWANAGTLGGAFARVGNPTVSTILGVAGVSFDGAGDAYVGPQSTPTLEGISDRSVEVWAYNPSIAGEETLVSWSRRNRGGNTHLTFNYGSDPGFGGAAHWNNDMGWTPVPAAGEWHHLVYTYDGTTARIYADGILNHSLPARLNTVGGVPIALGAQHDQNAVLIFASEVSMQSLAASLTLATVRIYAEALDDASVRALYDAERARFGR